MKIYGVTSAAGGWEEHPESGQIFLTLHKGLAENVAEEFYGEGYYAAEYTS